MKGELVELKVLRIEFEIFLSMRKDVTGLQRTNLLKRKYIEISERI